MTAILVGNQVITEEISRNQHRINFTYQNYY
jgi:hypothetical protein